MNFTTVQEAVAPSITADPSNQTVTAGQTATFTASASDGNPTPTTVQWQVSTDGVNFSPIAGATSTTLTLTNTTTAQNGSEYEAVFSNAAGLSVGTSPATLTVSAAVLTSIAVTPANPSVSAGQTEQFTATGTYSDNSTQNLTSSVTWASATPTVASISSTGLAQSLATGTTNITATLGGVTSPARHTHRHHGGADLDRRDPGQPDLAKGLTEQFTATGTYSDGTTADLTSQVTWASATPRSPASAAPVWPSRSPPARRISPQPWAA